MKLYYIEYFRVIKPVGNYQIGKKLPCFNGLVSGVNGIPFTNKEYFKPIKSKLIK